MGFTKRYRRSLDATGKFRGKCGICGHPDARHRMADAIRSRFRGGDSPESLARDYGMELEKVTAVLEGVNPKVG